MSALLQRAAAAMNGSEPASEPRKPSETIDPAIINGHDGTQMRAGLNQETVASYAELMKDAGGWGVFPPVMVFHDGTNYWLADGFHRVAAYEQASFARPIPAIICAGARRDAILHAAGANAAHGLPRTNADKRRAVETLLRDGEWGVWSDREIARRCHVSNRFVGDVRGDLLTVNGTQSEPAERTYTTRHGTTATMNTTGQREAAQQRKAHKPAPATPGAPVATSGRYTQAEMEAIIYGVLNRLPTQRTEKLIEWLDKHQTDDHYAHATRPEREINANLWWHAYRKVRAELEQRIAVAKRQVDEWKAAAAAPDPAPEFIPPGSAFASSYEAVAPAAEAPAGADDGDMDALREAVQALIRMEQRTPARAMRLRIIRANVQSGIDWLEGRVM